MAVDYNNISKYISAARLDKYEIVCKGNKKHALKLYQTNIRLSQAFYPLLSLLEVVLRNSINEEITNHFTDPKWLITQQTGFMVDKSLTYIDKRTRLPKSNHYLLKSVQKSISDISSAVTQGKIIANLTFGFWTSLFDSPHFSILVGVPARIFTKTPPATKRQMIFDKLNRIRGFRNRVYHNDHIIFAKDKYGNPIFSIARANQTYEDIRDIFTWLDLDFDAWTKKINNVPFELERANHVIDKYPSKKYYFYRIKLGITHYKTKYLQ